MLEAVLPKPWEDTPSPELMPALPPTQIELLSPRTAAFDQDGKKKIYQNPLRVPEYYWFDPFDPEERAGFARIEGVDRAIPRDDQGRLWRQCLNLAPVLWRGVYRGIEGTWRCRHYSFWTFRSSC